MTLELSYAERKNGWWFETRATVPCKLPKDGLLAVFAADDIEVFMDQHYPHDTYRDNSVKVWYFNDTRAREIAEKCGTEIFCNPQVLLQHFMRKV